MYMSFMYFIYFMVLSEVLKGGTDASEDAIMNKSIEHSLRKEILSSFPSFTERQSRAHQRLVVP